MKLQFVEKNISDFYIYKNKPVFIKSGTAYYNGLIFKADDNEEFFVDNNVFIKYGNHLNFRFVDNSFIVIDKFYDHINFFTETSWLEYRNKNSFYSRYVENSKFTDITITESPHFECRWLHNGVLVFNNPFTGNQILFYSTTGERLWEYKTENSDWKINRMCIPMVDDVVVIINSYNLMTVSIEGYNIQTGKKLWVLKDDKHTDIFPCHFNVGDDKMLYACKSHWKNTDRNSKNIELTSINPHNGEFNRHILKEVDQHTVISPWNTCIYGNKLYYADNHPGCVLGVVDLDKKQIVEEFSLNLKKGFRMGAPAVTEDKIYQFIRNKKEVWVFEK
ncbi:MAG: hypothetical protein II708_01160 [Paludibacteraceae bacterium]|nr:hypothetical protein [Paludibacteraceae bacterium]